jgi:nucleoside-diphosphate-sugar epimerase
LSDRVLILGGTGSFGRAVVEELLRRGRSVRCLVRDPSKAAKLLGEAPGLEVIKGDVQDAPALLDASEGCGAIVPAVNYPYPQWVPHMARATAHVIAAARAANATILFPGNVYGLGPQSTGPLTEDAPNLPSAHKGTLRVTIENSLQQAAEEGPARVIVLRAGDYFGPTVRNGLVDPLFENAAAGKPMRAIGKLDIPHQWAFVPDLARAALELLAISEQLNPYEVVNFAGYVAPTEREFLKLIAQQAQRPDLPIRSVPWSALKVAAVFDGVIRELLELRYLFDGSLILEGSKLKRLLPDFTETPVAEAVQATLESYRQPAENSPPR